MPPTAPAPVPVPAPPAPARRGKRLLRVGLVAIVLLVGLAFVAPLLLNLGFARGPVERWVAARAGTPVQIGSLHFGWFRGLQLERLAIGDVLTLERLDADLALLQLLRGRVDATVRARGLRAHLRQRADGSTNLPPFGQRSPHPAPAGDGAELDDLRLDFVLTGAELELVDERTRTGELVRLEQVTLRKEPGADFRLELAGELQPASGTAPGRIALVADLDAALRRPATLHFEVESLDLGRYRPLLVAFAGERALTQLEGELRGTLDLQVGPALIAVGGELTVGRPRLAGEWILGATLAAERWLVRPALRVQLEPSTPPRVESEGLAIDLGFARLHGMPPAAAAALAGGPALGVRLELDAPRFAAIGGPVPAELASGPSAITGQLALRLPPDAAALRRTLARTGGDGELSAVAQVAFARDGRPLGQLELRGVVAADPGRPVELALTAEGLALEPWRGLVERLLQRLPGPTGERRALTELDGVLAGSVRARIAERGGESTITTDGRLQVTAPKLQGPAIAGMRIAPAEWRLEPDLEIRCDAAGRLLAVDADRLAIELGYLRARGMPRARAAELLGDGAVGLDFELDPHRLAQLGGPVPAALVQAPVSLTGTLALAPGPAQWRGAFGLVVPQADAPGRLDVRVVPSAATAAASEWTLRAAAFELATWRPLLAGMFPAAGLETLAGRLDGEWRVRLAGDGSMESDGELTLGGAQVAAASLGEGRFAAERLLLRPRCRARHVDGAWAAPDLEGLLLDLGFARLEGITPAEARAFAGAEALGARCTLDLARLGPLLGGAPPQRLSASDAKLDGTIAVRLERGLLVPAVLAATFFESARAELLLAAKRLELAGHRLANLDATVRLQQRELTLALRDGATLHDGALALAGRVTFPEGPGDPRAELRASVRDAALDAAAVPWLRFPLPLLAGLEPTAAVDFKTRASFELEVDGPFRRGPGLAFAERGRDLQGRGALELRSGAFTPATALRELLALAGTGGQLRFDRIAGDLTLVGGAIRTERMRIEEGTRGFSLRGQTTLAGEVEYELDVTELLRGHRDGDKLLEALGGKAPDVRLRGDVQSPSLEMFAVEDLLRQAGKGAVESGLREALERLLQRRAGK